MGDAEHTAPRPLANGKTRIDFQTDPARYRHWKLAVDGEVATLTMDVDEKAGLFEGYKLKLNSYDLGVDIELADAVTRLRFEHPEVRAVDRHRRPRPRLLRGRQHPNAGHSSHGFKVNFCKYTNETRLAIEDASAHSGQHYIAACNGTAAGGGYELALACEQSTWSTTATPRRQSCPKCRCSACCRAPAGSPACRQAQSAPRSGGCFRTTEEGIKGKRAVEWRLVDGVVPGSKFDVTIATRAKEFAAQSPRNGASTGIKLTPLTRAFTADGVDYGSLSVEFDRAARIATVSLRGPASPPPSSADAMAALGADFWPLALARELDDAILHIRINELDVAAIVFKSSGNPAQVLAYDKFLDANKEHWLVREIRLFWKRVLKRVDLTSRSLVALIEPGSCFAGTLAELCFASDRSYMLAGARDGDNKPPAAIALSDANFGAYPMSNGLSRLQCRFLANPDAVETAKAARDTMFDAARALEFGLVTFAPDDIDWDDEVRVFLEERASFSPDALTGLEANLRFAGPETMESKIFARLTAWQNWIFQRPNAIGEEGALKRYGTGQKPVFDTRRV